MFDMIYDTCLVRYFGLSFGILQTIVGLYSMCTIFQLISYKTIFMDVAK